MLLYIHHRKVCSHLVGGSLSAQSIHREVLACAATIVKMFCNCDPEAEGLTFTKMSFALLQTLDVLCSKPSNEFSGQRLRA
jgi:hypothetical protein